MEWLVSYHATTTTLHHQNRLTGRLFSLRSRARGSNPMVKHGVPLPYRTVAMADDDGCCLVSNHRKSIHTYITHNRGPKQENKYKNERKKEEKKTIPKDGQNKNKNDKHKQQTKKCWASKRVKQRLAATISKSYQNVEKLMKYVAYRPTKPSY